MKYNFILVSFFLMVWLLNSCTQENEKQKTPFQETEKQKDLLLGEWGVVDSSEDIEFNKDLTVYAHFYMAIDERYEVFPAGVKIVDEIEGKKIWRWLLTGSEMPCKFSIDVNGKKVEFHTSKVSINPFYTNVKQVQRKGSDKKFINTKQQCNYYEKIPTQYGKGETETIYSKRTIGRLSVHAKYRFRGKEWVEIYENGNTSDGEVEVVIAELHFANNKLRLVQGKYFQIEEEITYQRWSTLGD